MVVIGARLMDTALDAVSGVLAVSGVGVGGRDVATTGSWGTSWGAAVGKQGGGCGQAGVCQGWYRLLLREVELVGFVCQADNAF
jgi:hypothetical protein